MKLTQRIAFTCFSLLYSYVSIGQDTITVAPSTEKMSLGYNSCVQAFIPEANALQIGKLWKKRQKEQGFKVKKSSGELIIHEVFIKELSDSLISVYSTTEEAPQGTYLNVFYELEDGFLRSEQREKYQYVENLIYQFALKGAKHTVNKQIEDSEKELSRLRKQQERLIREKEKLLQIIESCKKRILESEQNVIKNGEAQNKQQENISLQQANVEKLKDKLNKIK